MTMRSLASVLAGAAVAVTSALVAPPADAASGVSGIPTQSWHLVRPSYCVQNLSNGSTTLYIYPQTGGYVWSTEQDVVGTLSAFCAVGVPFYVYSTDGSTWSSTYYQAGLI